MGGENPLGQEELHGLAAVPDRPLPVLGRLTTGDVLELVWGKPGVTEPNARAFRSLENEMNFIFPKDCSDISFYPHLIWL